MSSCDTSSSSIGRCWDFAARHAARHSQHARAPDRWEWGHQWDESSVAIFLSRPWWGCCGGSFFVMFLFFLARAQQVSCGSITVLTSTKKKVHRVLARKSLPRTNQNSPSAFSHQIRNNSKKDKTKTSQMMGWIKNRPNKFLNQNFVRQGLPAKCKSVRFRFISLM